MPWKRKSREPAPEDVMDREIAFHIAKLTEDLVEQGLSPNEARRCALLEFGGREQVKQKVREVHVSALSEALLFNLRSAAVQSEGRAPVSAQVAFVFGGGDSDACPGYRRKQRSLFGD